MGHDASLRGRGQERGGEGIQQSEKERKSRGRGAGWVMDAGMQKHTWPSPGLESRVCDARHTMEGIVGALREEVKFLVVRYWIKSHTHTRCMNVYVGASRDANKLQGRTCRPCRQTDGARQRQGGRLKGRRQRC